MQVPQPPGTEDQPFEFVQETDAADNETPKGDRNELYKTLEQELIQQIRVRSLSSIFVRS